MHTSSRIFVAGHRGLVGSAIVRELKRNGFEALLTVERTHLDLENTIEVEEFFARERPEFVFLAAARVGGIHANSTYPADFIRSNLRIQLNVMESARKNHVRKLVFLGSSCIYPRAAPQPLREEYLLSGLLEPTNEPYAIAKIAGIIQARANNKQYGTNFVSVMPTNLYGPGDNFDPLNSHVIPGLIRRFDEAKRLGRSEVTVWGTGQARREFLYVDDMATACVLVMEKHDGSELINIGCGEDVTIVELTNLVADEVGYKGRIVFDSTKPDGPSKKLLEISKIRALGWRPMVDLRTGLRLTYKAFLRADGRSVG